MVSKTRVQRQKTKAKLKANDGVMPQVVPSPKKSIHLKKTRPNMKGKHKIRMGMESADIYEGFEDKKGVMWKCQQCGKVSRVIGYCLACTGGVAPKAHTGLMMARDGSAQQRAAKAAVAGTLPKRGLASSAKKESKDGSKKKMRFKKKH